MILFGLVDVFVMYVRACVQVTAGSMWEQDDADDDDDDAEDTNAKPCEKYLVKWGGMSYLHVSWETTADLIELTTKHIKSKVLWYWCWWWCWC